MRSFAIYSLLTRKRRACAWLLYEPGIDSYSIELADWAGEDDLPLFFAPFAKRGERVIGDSLARMWAYSRVFPQDRDAVEQMLKAYRLGEYYLPTIIARSKGRSSNDDFLVEEVSSRDYRNAPLQEEPLAPTEIGIELGRARRALGMTQKQLAEKTGVQQAAISRIERGGGNPTIATLEALARGTKRNLHISLD